MKPFSKMEAIGFGKPVVTRDGRKVTHLLEISANIEYPVVGVVEHDDCVSTWASDGKYDIRNSESLKDLFMASTKKSGFVALGQYKYGDVAVTAYSTHVFKTAEEAERSFKADTNKGTLYALVPVSWEE